MAIYYFMLEAVPLPGNQEEEKFEGAFINCWVNSTSMESALTEATDYIHSEGWAIQKWKTASLLIGSATNKIQNYWNHWNVLIKL